MVLKLELRGYMLTLSMWPFFSAGIFLCISRLGETFFCNTIKGSVLEQVAHCYKCLKCSTQCDLLVFVHHLLYLMSV